MDPQTIAAAARSLLKQAELPPLEVERRLKLALSAEYWRAVAPHASMQGVSAGTDVATIGAQEIARETRRLTDEGYFRLHDVVNATTIDRMYRTLTAVRSAGWPATFAFVFDDFWCISGCATLRDFLTAALGGRYRQNSVVWAHWVAGEAGHSGWHPHSDMADQGDRFLSIWLAVSEATTDNGCMFLVRRRALTPEIAQAIRAKQALPYGSYRSLLNNVIALPVKAGSVIGWRGDIVHWGGINTGGTEPRISLALELRAHDAEASPFERPLIDPTAPPPFNHRLGAIAKVLLEYSKFEPDMSRYRGLAERIRQSVGPLP